MTGSGTQSDPYIIYDVNDLQAMENDLTAYYELANDIDASATIGWSWIAGDGFRPIGYYYEDAEGTDHYTFFAGHFDGKGHIISNLYQRVTKATLGLFGNVGWTGPATVRNVGLIDCDLHTDCEGSVHAIYVGAFISQVLAGSLVEKCFCTGNIKGKNAADTTGFVGYCALSTIQNNYSRVTVDGEQIGDYHSRATTFAGSVGFDALIKNCYGTGFVNSDNFWRSSGFCYLLLGTITDCFWDTQTSGQDTSDGGTGKTTAEMKAKSTFTDAGWDLDTIWDITPSCNNDYPCLLDVTPACGVPVIPFIINKAYALSREEL